MNRTEKEEETTHTLHDFKLEMAKEIEISTNRKFKYSHLSKKPLTTFIDKTRLNSTHNGYAFEPYGLYYDHNNGYDRWTNDFFIGERMYKYLYKITIKPNSYVTINDVPNGSKILIIKTRSDDEQFRDEYINEKNNIDTRTLSENYAGIEWKNGSIYVSWKDPGVGVVWRSTPIKEISLVAKKTRKIKLPSPEYYTKGNHYAWEIVDPPKPVEL